MVSKEKALNKAKAELSAFLMGKYNAKSKRVRSYRDTFLAFGGQISKNNPVS
jgi:hypothetical protein